MALAHITVCRYHTELQYPLLDSFPNIFPAFGGQTRSLPVHASLSTTTRVIDRVKELQNIVGRAIAVEDRETLFNGLGEIAEAYEEGWDGGSDVDSDD